MTLYLSALAKQLSGQRVGADVAITSVSIDSRSLQAGDVYIAIKGHQHDGHAFLAETERAGACAAIIEASSTTQLTIPHLIVTDTRIALAQLATLWRQHLPACTVIGITGSNGKTTVKEMTAAVMGDASTVLYTQGNLNNAIGVPLTLLRLTQAHHYAVIEMGANHPGEIAFVNTCAHADIVIITNAANAHLAGFGDVAGVAKAKGEIISTLNPEGIVILNRDDAYFDYWQTLAGSRKILSFGLHNQADIRAEHIQSSIQAQQFVTSFELISAGQRYHCTLALAGQHNVLNALAACAVGLAAGIPIATLITRLKKVNSVTGRLQALVGRQGQLIIDDTYNANADSLAAALNVLQQCPGQPWLVLGAFGELGPASAELHYELGLQIKKSGVMRLFAVGDDCQHTVAAFGEGAQYCHDHAELMTQLNNALTGQETLLIKGSRSQKMEHIVASLVENFRT